MMAMSKERKAELLGKVSGLCLDGINYAQYLNVSDTIKQLEVVRQLDIRDDDVITLGFPRSGNHWAFEVVNMVVHQSTSFAKDTFYSVLMESLGDNTHAKLSKLSSPRVLTSHNHARRLPDQAVKKQVKLIYILRNPKDVIVSLYKLAISVKEEFGTFTGTWDEYLQLHLSGDHHYGPWFDSVLAMEKFIKEHPECPVYIHVFEEMKNDPIGRIKELCSFLGKPDTLAEQIAAVTEFSNMKKELNTGKLEELHQAFMKDKNVIIRKGQTGDWKNWFTVAQNEMFNEIFEEKMAGSKLGEMVRQYIM